MTVEHVGGHSALHTGGATCTSDSWTSVSGSLIVVVAHYYNTAGAAANGDVTDSKGNSYTLWPGSEVAGSTNITGTAVYYNNAGTRGTTHTVSVNRVNDNGSLTNCSVIEITGQHASPINTTADATSNDATSPYDVTAGAALPTNNIAIYGNCLDTGDTNAYGAPAGYTAILVESDGSSTLCSAAYYKVNESGTPTVGATKGGTISNAASVFVCVDMVDPGVTGTSAQTLAAFTSTASGTVMNPPAVLWVKEVGFVTNTTGATSDTITVASGGVPIGDTIVIFGACDNTSTSPTGGATTIAVADNSNNAGTANTYTLQTSQAIADPGAASAGQQGFFVVCPVTRSLDAGDTITITYGNSTGAKAINAQQFTGVNTTTPVLASSYTTQNNQTGQVVTLSATPDTHHQAVCVLVAVEGGTADAYTEDADTTDGPWVTLTRRGSGTTTGGSTLNSAYKLVNNTGTPSAQSYGTATSLGTSRDHCAAILILDTQPITGTSAQTLTAFTSTASGSVDATTTGSSAQTLVDFTSTASGTLTITGTSAQTLADFTSTVSGTVANPVTGTSAQTLADFTSTASGALIFTGSSAQTLVDFTGAATGNVSTGTTGSGAATLADFTSSATATETFTGTSAQTLAAFTSTATGTETITGTSAQTLAAFTSTATGTETITGTSAQTLVAFTSTATATETITGSAAVTLASFIGLGNELSGLFAAAISTDGRYFEDQFGDPWLGNGMSIQMWQNYQPGGADITSLLSTSESLGINLWQCIGNAKGAAMNAPEDGSDWDGELPYTGGNITTPNSAYWLTTIRAHVRACAQVGITVLLNPVDNISWANDFGSETDADCRTLGQQLGDWFGDEPNILWSIGNDWQDGQWSALNSKYGSLLRGIREGGGGGGASQPFMIWAQYLRSISTDNTDWDGTTDRGGYTWEYPDFNGVYTYYTTEIECKRAWQFDNIPVMMVETHYWQSRFHTVDGISTTTRKAVRKQVGRAITWGALAGAIPSSDDLSLATTSADTDLTDVVFAHCARIMNHVTSLSGWETLVPDYSAGFVTTNADTVPTQGDVDTPPANGNDADTTDFTTASVAVDGSFAVAYVTATGNTFDLTELTGTPTHYWFDPMSGDTSTPTTGQPTYPGNNDAGDPDWLLVFLGGVEITGTAAATLTAFTSTATATETFTGSSAQTLAAFTSTASGAEAFTGSSAQTLAAFTSTATGAESFTGTSAQTLAAFTSTASGSVTAPTTGSAAVTLAAATSTAAGTETFTGTSAQTLVDFTTAAAGTVIAPVVGTSAQTLIDFTAAAAGIVANPVTGTSAQTLVDFTSTAFGLGGDLAVPPPIVLPASHTGVTYVPASHTTEVTIP